MRAGRSALRADRCGTGQRVAWRPGRQPRQSSKLCADVHQSQHRRRL